MPSPCAIGNERSGHETLYLCGIGIGQSERMCEPGPATCSIFCGSSLMRWNLLRQEGPEHLSGMPNQHHFASRKNRSLEAFQQPIPPPVSLTAEEQAEIIARSYRYDREWEARGAGGRAPREYDRAITFVLTSGALFRSPSIDLDMLQFWFLSNPYPGIICGSESQVGYLWGIYLTRPVSLPIFNPGRETR